MCRSCGCKTPAVRQVDNQGELAVSVCALCLVSLLAWQQVGSFYVASRFIGALIFPPCQDTPTAAVQSRAACVSTLSLCEFPHLHCVPLFHIIFMCGVALLPCLPGLFPFKRCASERCFNESGKGHWPVFTVLTFLKPLFQFHVCLQAVQIHVGVTQ